MKNGIDTKKYASVSWNRRLKRGKGATLFEYTVIVALVSIAAIVILASIGGTTNTKLAPVPNGFQ